jgi:hypothetical protein
MFRWRPGKPGDDDASAYSRRSAVADSVWIAQDRIRSGFAAGFGGIADAARRPFERVAYSFRVRLAWPLQDRAAAIGAPARALSTLAAILLAAGAGVAGLIAATPDGSSERATLRVAATTAPVKVKAAPQKPAEPTLQGAAPVFEPAKAEPASEVNPAKAIVKSAPAESSAAADTAQSSSPAATSSAAKSPEIDGPPAGPEAIAVARNFAVAFVHYETGETDADVRKAFGESATPALARALLKRPPRLPANVEVPKAKVVNVVPAPSHGDVYPVSVSLLRVGLTSELRLDMEERKGEGWRVTNVLG